MKRIDKKYGVYAAGIAILAAVCIAGTACGKKKVSQQSEVETQASEAVEETSKTEESNKETTVEETTDQETEAETTAEESTEESSEVDTAKTDLAAIADQLSVFKAMTKENEGRRLEIRTNRTGAVSEIQEQDGYYELTNCIVVAPKEFEKSFIEDQLSSGVITIEGVDYPVVRDNRTGEYPCIELEEDAEYQRLWYDQNRDVYILSGYSDVPMEETLYQGSVYFIKNCTVIGLNITGDESVVPSWEHEVAFEDYISKPGNEIIVMYGVAHTDYSSGDAITFDGTYEMNDQGIITLYKEQFWS